MNTIIYKYNNFHIMSKFNIDTDVEIFQNVGGRN